MVEANIGMMTTSACVTFGKNPVTQRRRDQQHILTMVAWAKKNVLDGRRIVLRPQRMPKIEPKRHKDVWSNGNHH